MRRYRGPDGKDRLWVDPEEIETTMEQRLSLAGLLPSPDTPVVDIEAFVERRLRVEFDPYAPLPPDVLGETEFRRGARPRMSINRDLTGAALDDDESPLGLRGRWRATVAHEGAHVILHDCLFDLSPRQATFFDDESTNEPPPLQRCLKRDVLFRAGGDDWREVQANKGMAALLMPRSVFLQVWAKELGRRRFKRVDAGSAIARDLAAVMAKTCEVSVQAASIRLATLQLLSAPGQMEIL